MCLTFYPQPAFSTEYMSEILLARAAGLTKESRQLLTSYGIDLTCLSGGELLLIELAVIPLQLKQLEQEGHFLPGEQHIWHVERITTVAMTILVRKEGSLNTIVVPTSNIVSIAIRAVDSSAEHTQPFSDVAAQSIDQKDGVPRLSQAQIEGEAVKFLVQFGSTRLRRPEPTNLKGIVALLSSQHAIHFDFESDLGFTNKKRKVLGRCSVDKRSIQVDRILNPGPRFNFTLAHELGHLFLHHAVRLQNPSAIPETRKTVTFRQNPTVTPTQWIEWQANTFAAGILMPTVTLPEAVKAYQRARGLTNRLGMVFLDDQPYNRAMYCGLVHNLRQLYKVSATVVTIRLKTLGILQTDTRFEPKHISEFLRAA
jgi:Zn-dependent peptidase ImmA (M78 family)